MGTSSVTAADARGAAAVSAPAAATRSTGAAVTAAVVAAIVAAAAPAGAEPDPAAVPHPTPGAGEPAPAPGGAAAPHETPPSPAPPAPHPDQVARAETGYRFAFHPSGDGYLRLDRATGAVAVCAPEGNTWTCSVARDDRAALDTEVARLQRDNAALKNALLEHGIALPGGIAPAPAPSPSPQADDAGKPAAGNDQSIPRPPQTVPPSPGTMPAPGERRVVDAVMRTWRRLEEIMSDLRRELQ